MTRLLRGCTYLNRTKYDAGTTKSPALNFVDRSCNTNQFPTDGVKISVYKLKSTEDP